MEPAFAGDARRRIVELWGRRFGEGGHRLGLDTAIWHPVDELLWLPARRQPRGVSQGGRDLDRTFGIDVEHGLTGGWIAESPLSIGTGGARQLPLSDFGRISFFDLTQNGANPRLGESGNAFIMTDGQDRVLCNPSAPAASGDAFTACFGSEPCG